MNATQLYTKVKRSQEEQEGIGKGGGGKKKN